MRAHPRKKAGPPTPPSPLRLVKISSRLLLLGAPFRRRRLRRLEVHPAQRAGQSAGIDERALRGILSSLGKV